VNLKIGFSSDERADGRRWEESDAYSELGNNEKNTKHKSLCRLSDNM